MLVTSRNCKPKIAHSDMTTITLDCETIGTDDPAVIAEIAKTITPPGNISKAETIAAWTAEKKPALIEEAVKRTSFDGTYGRIICIGMAIDDAPATAKVIMHPFAPADEAALLADAFNDIQSAAKHNIKSGTMENAVTFIGHNLASFDLRFLWQRAVINGIKPPACLLKAMQAKPWDAVIQDTMLMWSPERERRISLDRLCKALGVPTSKDGMTGADVWQAFKEGRLDDIAIYCKADVEATRACWKRLVFAA